MNILSALVFFSTISFLIFGISCFTTSFMRSEFERYGLTNSRYLIGILQVLGALGLGIGYVYLPTIAVIAALGLAFLMILGFAVRLKIKDTFIQSAPSISYALLNAYIALEIINEI